MLMVGCVKFDLFCFIVRWELSWEQYQMNGFWDHREKSKITNLIFNDTNKDLLQVIWSKPDSTPRLQTSVSLISPCTKPLA